MGGLQGVLAFLTIVGSFFLFMVVLALVTASTRASRRVYDHGWPIKTDPPVSFMDLLLQLVWGVVVVAALMTWPVAILAFVVVSMPFIFGSHLSLPEVLRDLLTAEIVYGIVIAASLLVGIALFVSLLIGELISVRKHRIPDDL
jgi:hypothetical protein